MNPIKKEWINKKTWNNNVFNSLERFVTNQTEERIEKFSKTGQLSDLYEDETTVPNPKPTKKHREYMVEYAEYWLENN